MKNLIVTTFLILATTMAQASHANEEICGLELNEDGTESGLYTETEILDIKTVDSITHENMVLLKKYYAVKYKKEVTFEQLKTAFAKGGSEQRNDLYILKFNFKETGNTYYEVRTYPGDAAEGLVINPTTKEIQATNRNATYTVNLNGKKIDCSALNTQNQN